MGFFLEPSCAESFPSSPTTFNMAWVWIQTKEEVKSQGSSAFTHLKLTLQNKLSSLKPRFNHSTKWPNFFPLICGIQAIFTVGGNKSLTVSNYLKNKTTHTKQNKTKIYAANCQETQKPQLPVIKIVPSNYHKLAYLESICVSAQCFPSMIAVSWAHARCRTGGDSAMGR